jgi:hypothetical protein
MAEFPRSGYLRRLIGAAALDTGVYEEVEADRTATPQAFATVLLSSVASGIGARGAEGYTVASIAFASMVSLIAWAAWALVVLQIGTRLMPRPQTRSDVGELLRTIGFASAPGLIRAIGAFPAARGPAFVISAIWMLAAMVVAVRQSLDYESTARAAGVCALGWALALAIAIGIGVVFGPAVY